MTWLIQLFPNDWRQEYGEEVADMLAASPHPWRDRADLLRAAVVVQAERIGPMRKIYAVAIALIALGALGGVWATAQLANGITEIPQHWWSSLAALPAAVGVGLAVVARARHPRLDPT